MKTATRDAYGKTLAKLVSVDKNIIVLDADLASSTKTSEAKKVAPERHFDVGIAEANMMGIAAGLATCGHTVFASTFAVFATGRAYDQIRNSIAYPRLNVKICATHSGLTVGEDGASHQALEDLALMRALPNMKVFCPCDAKETEKIIEYVASFKGPCYVRLGRSKVEDVFSEDCDFKPEKGVMLSDGKTCTIISTGFETGEVKTAVDRLKSEGIDIRHIHIHTIKPIDEETIIKAAEETPFIITAEEHSVIGGLGDAVLSVLCDKRPTKVYKVGVQDKFGESGTAEELIEKYGLSSNKIYEFIKSVI